MSRKPYDTHTQERHGASCLARPTYQYHKKRIHASDVNKHMPVTICKGNISVCKTSPFTARKMTFYNVKGHLSE